MYGPWRKIADDGVAQKPIRSVCSGLPGYHGNHAQHQYLDWSKQPERQTRNGKTTLLRKKRIVRDTCPIASIWGYLFFLELCRMEFYF